MNASLSTSPSSGDGDSNSAGTTAVEGTVVGLAVVAVILRFYTRIFTKAGLGWDDWLILAALVTTLAAGALLLECTAVEPNGAAISDDPNGPWVNSLSQQLYLRLLLVVSVLYFALVSTTKLGILLLYKRLFSVRRASFKFQVVALCILVIGYWIGCTVATLTNCRPIQQSWMFRETDPKYCFNFNIFWMAAGAVEVLLDVMILALPIQVVSSLHLSARKKWLVSGIFLLGAFVVVTGLLKTVLGYKPGGSSLPYSRIEVWTSIHTGMAIICSCLPIFGPLIKKTSHSKAAVQVSNSFVAQKIAKASFRRRKSPFSIDDSLQSAQSMSTRPDANRILREGTSITTMAHSQNDERYTFEYVKAYGLP